MRRRTVAFVALAAVFLSACGEEPQSVQDLSPAYTVAESPDLVVVGVDTSGSGYSAVFGLGMDIKRIAKFIATHPEKHPDVGTIRLEATTAVIDGYGNEGTQRTLDLAMDRATMERINYDRITMWSLLNLTRPTIRHRLGREMVAEYCQDDNAQKYSTDFCIAALM